MGRNCKLTKELTEKICELIRSGNYVKVAAQACGICEGTYYNWVKQGEKAKSGKYFEFLKLTTRAKAEFETTAVKEIGYKYKSWLLERRHPDRWGNKQKIEHSGDISYEVRFVKEYNGHIWMVDSLQSTPETATIP